MIVEETAACLREAGYSSIRLGIDKGNPQSSRFWKKNGFRVMDEIRRGGWNILYAERKLQDEGKEGDG